MVLCVHILRRKRGVCVKCGYDLTGNGQAAPILAMLMNRVKRGIAQDVTSDFRSFEGINPELGSMVVADEIHLPIAVFGSDSLRRRGNNKPGT